MKGKHLALAAVLVVAAAAPAAAQRAASLEHPAASATVLAPGHPLTPLAATRSGISLEDAQPLTLNLSAARMGKREGRALALVGGAAVIAGLLIGDDAGTAIAIGGAGLGLYGLYVWQR